MTEPGPHFSHAREKITLLHRTLVGKHEGFHSGNKWKPACNSFWFSELPRRFEFLSRGFAVVLALKFLLGPAHFVGMPRARAVKLRQTRRDGTIGIFIASERSAR